MVPSMMRVPSARALIGHGCGSDQSTRVDAGRETTGVIYLFLCVSDGSSLLTHLVLTLWGREGGGGGNVKDRRQSCRFSEI